MLNPGHTLVFCEPVEQDISCDTAAALQNKNKLDTVDFCRSMMLHEFDNYNIRSRSNSKFSHFSRSKLH